ncbi:hypothetical protein [Kitasatospora xanthocidica]|uniref:hypothetical protein n=1 Tax=Kitasatospora xanthocidica TaxID=83382 RepID=UPI0027E4F218|nr:hypothetical protein [Kitasatospora xanthocidica]
METTKGAPDDTRPASGRREEAADLDAWQETRYLLRSPANAERLMAAIARDRADRLGVAGAVEDLASQADPGR